MDIDPVLDPGTQFAEGPFWPDLPCGFVKAEITKALVRRNALPFSGSRFIGRLFVLGIANVPSAHGSMVASLPLIDIANSHDRHDSAGGDTSDRWLVRIPQSHYTSRRHIRAATSPNPWRRFP
jgi:hypothetical protein